MELIAPEDQLVRSKCLGRLGGVEYRRMLEAIEQNRSPEVRAAHLIDKIYCEQALNIVPTDTLPHQSSFHNQLGLVYQRFRDTESAFRYYQQSIRCSETMHDRFMAGGTRGNVARALAVEKRFAEAREWMKCALDDFKASENSDREVVATLKLLEQTESALVAN